MGPHRLVEGQWRLEPRSHHTALSPLGDPEALSLARPPRYHGPMARILKIAQIGHPILRTPAQPVDPAELAAEATQQFIDDLIHTMRDANGAGLAAPQVFAPLRICAIEVQDNPRYPYKPPVPLTLLVNPVLEPLGTDPTFSNFEGCLSVPNLRGRVERHPHLRVTALDRHGAPLDFEVHGLTAGTFQHEVDHLDGTLFVDRVRDPDSFCTWEHFERYHKGSFAEEAQTIVQRYGA